MVLGAAIIWCCGAAALQCCSQKKLRLEVINLEV